MIQSSRFVLGEIATAILFVAVAPRAATAGESALAVTEGARGTTLALKGMMPFHATANIVVDPYTLAIPRTSGVAIVWNEVSAAGDVQHFYAVSRDGRSTPRVFPTSYILKLRYAEFDPAVDTPIVPASLRADSANTLHIVQFVTQPLPAFQAFLRKIGASIHTPLVNNALIVGMESRLAEIVARLPFVRWVGPFHPAYKLDEAILDAFEAGRLESEMHTFSIQASVRGIAAQRQIANRIVALGGSVLNMNPDGFRMTVTITLAQVIELAHMDQTFFIDPWGPGETDTGAVRLLGGAVPILSNAGITGQGVRGEIFDLGVDPEHPEWNGQPPLVHGPAGAPSTHGTSVYGIIFSTGVVQPSSTGLCPDREQGIACYFLNSTQFGGSLPRHQLNREATDPNDIYRSVFQTSAVGSPRTRNYTTITAETDDYLFLYDYLSCQSMSNANLTPDTRPQAWAKNIVAVGGILHQGTIGRDDDRSAGSTGPAADGRIKPDLAHVYDGVYTTTSGGGYTVFAGSSAATPATAGYFGLLFQMWHEGVFAGFGGGTSVFDSRCKSTTAKALMINTAYRYDWNVSGPNSNMWRDRQGWGMAHGGRLYLAAENLFIVDETDLLEPLGVNTYYINVERSDEEFRATMVYIDPAGNPASTVHRINDLTLKVTTPGNVVYWGNHGLRDTNYSTPGGNPSTVDTTENVFIENPAVGRWTVEILGDEIVQDSHLETPAIDADYALVIFAGRVSLKGDLNCDGAFNGADIDAFFLALGDPAAYATRFPNCDPLRGDMNGDGQLDSGDIDAFFVCLGGGGCP